MRGKGYKINEYLSFLKGQIREGLDKHNLEWRKYGHSLLIIDMTNERTFIVYDPAILGHWDFDERDAYEDVVENHFGHITRMEKHPNVLPFRPPKGRRKC
jgi:hypothetical protein